MALVAAVLMLVAILVSALGTHREIGRLPKPEIEARLSIGQHFRELAQTMKNRAFLVLILAGVCVYTNQGVGYALSNYLYSFVWQFSGTTFALLPFALFTGVICAFVVAPLIGRRTSKPKAAVWLVLGNVVLLTVPYWLRLAGAFPDVGSPALVPLLFGFIVLHTACSVSSFILGASMMADVVEESEARTGRRSEGVFFAGSFFVQKCTSGVGIFFAGVILSMAAFPQEAHPGQVPVPTLDRLTLIYASVYVVLGLAAAALFARFPFGRAEHEARLARMAAGAGEEGTPHTAS
jgi:GPH family glycoside/pentoside/hexuronide:cation symporter